jgi:hypothetical protein
MLQVTYYKVSERFINRNMAKSLTPAQLEAFALKGKDHASDCAFILMQQHLRSSSLEETASFLVKILDRRPFLSDYVLSAVFKPNHSRLKCLIEMPEVNSRLLQLLGDSSRSLQLRSDCFDALAPWIATLESPTLPREVEEYIQVVLHQNGWQSDSMDAALKQLSACVLHPCILERFVNLASDFLLNAKLPFRANYWIFKVHHAHLALDIVHHPTILLALTQRYSDPKRRVVFKGDIVVWWPKQWQLCQMGVWLALMSAIEVPKVSTKCPFRMLCKDIVRRLLTVYLGV